MSTTDDPRSIGYRNLLKMVTDREYSITISQKRLLDEEGQGVPPHEMEFHSMRDAKPLLIFAIGSIPEPKVEVGTFVTSFFHNAAELVNPSRYEEGILLIREEELRTTDKTKLNNLVTAAGSRLRVVRWSMFEQDIIHNNLQPIQFRLIKRATPEHRKIIEQLGDYKPSNLFRVRWTDPISNYYGAYPEDIFQVTDLNFSNAKSDSLKPEMVTDYYALVSGVTPEATGEGGEEEEEEEEDEGLEEAVEEEEY